MTLAARESSVIDALRARASEMRRDLRELVGIPTGHGHAAGLEQTRAWFGARLSALGATITRMPGGDRPAWLRESAKGSDAGETLVAAAPRGEGSRLLISGHLDTVHDPNGAFRELTDGGNGSLVGPGAIDMKGGLVLAVHALEVLHGAGIKNGWTVVLNADEEVGSFRSERALAALAKSHDIGLVMEPAYAGGEIVTARAGSVQFRVDAFGREAHAGRDAASGISAIGPLCAAITRLLAASDPASGLTLNIGPLEGGTATNIVPGHAAAWGNARYRTDAQRVAIDTLLASVECGSESDLPRVRVRVCRNRPVKPATREVEAIADVACAIAGELGFTLGRAMSGGVSDANTLQAAGLPCLDGLGPRGGNMHRTDEFVIEASLVERASLLALLVLRLREQGSVPWRT
jgi:glutamate carboxypeptidase